MSMVGEMIHEMHEEEKQQLKEEIDSLKKLLRRAHALVSDDECQGAFIIADVHGYKLTDEFGQRAKSLWKEVEKAVGEFDSEDNDVGSS